jgi:hypothetical protein
VPKRISLSKVGDVLREVKRVYLAAYAGEMTWQDAGCAARVLREARYCIEGDLIEQRVAALEERLAGDTARRNGGTRYGAARV